MKFVLKLFNRPGAPLTCFIDERGIQLVKIHTVCYTQKKSQPQNLSMQRNPYLLSVPKIPQFF